MSVTRASSPYMASITGFQNLNPAFSKTVYTGYVSNTTASPVKLTPTAEDSTASITINGTPVTSGFLKVNLNAGANTITVIVTSSVGVDSRTYVFTVNKS